MTLAALITFLIAQAFPIVELDANGITSQTTLIGAIVALWSENMQVVAVLVFCSTILFPLTELLALLYVLVPLRAGYVPAGFNLVLRAIQLVRPWGMIEVFMLGILVTLVKMVSLARVIPEAALFAFGALTLMIAVVVSFDPGALWDIAERARRGSAPCASGPSVSVARQKRERRRFRQETRAMNEPEAAASRHAPDCISPPRRAKDSCRVIRAAACSRVRTRSSSNDARAATPRCTGAIRTASRARGRYSSPPRSSTFRRTCIRCMHTSSIVGSEDDTIMSGVALFWNDGDYPLAMVIFIASILVPMLKLGTLAFLTRQRADALGAGVRASARRCFASSSASAAGRCSTSS